MNQVDFTEAAFHQLSAQDIIVKVIGGHYSYAISEVEMALWLTMVRLYGEDALRIFTLDYIRSGNRQEPRPHSFEAFVDPSKGSPVVAFEHLRELVARVGPYESPPIDGAMAAAVRALGGWPQVNSELPIPDDRFAYDAYRKRFEAAFTSARSALLLGKADGSRPLGLHDLSRSAPRLPGDGAGFKRLDRQGG